MKRNGEYVGAGLSNVSRELMYTGSALHKYMEVYGNNTYDLSTAASYLGISESRLIDLVNSGIPYIKIGNGYVFSKNALDKWLENVRIELE